MQHHYQVLIDQFNLCFSQSHNTRLLRGTDEPIYIPSANSAHSYHAIYFAHGFFSSALHECAHWFIAGIKRRQWIDYGYWYQPDGRTETQQLLFQQVEVKPQALELILSLAANYRFNFSADNLTGEASDMSIFKKKVIQCAFDYCQQGLPQRAQRFQQRLSHIYQTPSTLNLEHLQAYLQCHNLA